MHLLLELDFLVHISSPVHERNPHKKHHQFVAVLLLFSVSEQSVTGAQQLNLVPWAPQQYYCPHYTISAAISSYHFEGKVNN